MYSYPPRLSSAIFLSLPWVQPLSLIKPFLHTCHLISNSIIQNFEYSWVSIPLQCTGGESIYDVKKRERGNYESRGPGKCPRDGQKMGFFIYQWAASQELEQTVNECRGKRKGIPSPATVSQPVSGRPRGGRWILVASLKSIVEWQRWCREWM